MNYVLSPCPFAAEGIIKILGCENVSSKSAWSGKSYSDIFKGTIYIYLPKSTLHLLKVLKDLLFIVNHTNGPLNFIVITNSNNGSAYNTLKNMAKKDSGRVRIHILPKNISISEIKHKLNKLSTGLYDSKEHLDQFEIASNNHNTLTGSEIDVMINLLLNKSVAQIAQEKNLSVKTIYSQKNKAIKKIASLAQENYDGVFLMERKKRKGIITLTEKERFFLESLQDGRVYNVFQPISDLNSFAGFEMLVRWDDGTSGKENAIFMKDLKNSICYDALFFKQLKEAICYIKKSYGRFFYSINLSAESLASKTFKKDLLSELGNCPRAILKNIKIEISEEVKIDKEMHSIIKSIKDIGLKVFLDDCYSERSAHQPEDVAFFDGYKIDSSVISRMKYNEDMRSRLKTLLYKCFTENCYCIAEGIESEEDYLMLKRMGVKYFQGNYLTAPVSLSEMKRLCFF